MSMGAPLTGIRVLDLTQLVSGPAATMLLADLGAEVIKIERPCGGEPYRREGRILQNNAGSVSVNFLRFNRNKRSLTLNLKQETGRRLLKQLVQVSDVLVENFRSGVMKRLGLDYESLQEVNQRLIYASITGFGSEDMMPSPYSKLPAYAIISEAYAGLLHLVGEGPEQPPHWLGFALGDIAASLNAVIGIVLALYDRERSGRGRRVDVSLYDSAIFMNDQAIALYSATGEIMQRGSYRLQAPWGVFPVSDGYVVVAVMGDEQWRNLCQAIGRLDLAEDDRCRTGELRALHMEELIRPALEKWLRNLKREQAVRVLQAHEVPSAPVNTAADLFACPHVSARHMLVPFEHPVVGTVSTVGNPVKLSDLPRVAASPPPELGQDTDQILQSLLGLGDDELKELRRECVI